MNEQNFLQFKDIFSLAVYQRNIFLIQRNCFLGASSLVKLQYIMCCKITLSFGNKLLLQCIVKSQQKFLQCDRKHLQKILNQINCNISLVEPNSIWIKCRQFCNSSGLKVNSRWSNHNSEDKKNNPITLMILKSHWIKQYSYLRFTFKNSTQKIQRNLFCEFLS